MRFGDVGDKGVRQAAVASENDDQMSETMINYRNLLLIVKGVIAFTVACRIGVRKFLRMQFLRTDLVASLD